MTSWFKKSALVEQWGRRNLAKARFRIGQEARIISAPDGFKQWVGTVVKIRAMNEAGMGDGEYFFEYLVTKYPILLWEDELEAA